MTLDDNWFTEIDEDIQSAFSLRIRRKLHDEQSPYQHIEVYETEGFGNLLVIDGFTMVSSRDNFLYHEMMTHPVLFTHPDPKRVAIIGGGDCGSLREVLRHPGVEHCVQIDIDERVTRVSERFFPELCEANDDPRAELLFIDGIRWMEEAEPGSLDVIIVDSTDPIGPGEVLFTPAFYAACRRALGEEGLMVQQSESPLAHMPILERMYRGFREAGFGAIHTLFFPQPIYPTGWWSATLAGKGARIPDFREEDARNKPFPTRYYNAEVHRGALAQPEFFREAVQDFLR
ncbi:MAG TPA: polyamine aminopropyltransferase [Gammaproteobacteria bacterium]|nr:polyamine aminopropyltransferase [Gammaproteobacteria bacterium]